MRSVSIFEAMNEFSALIDAVEAGEEVRVARHGRAVARVMPIDRPSIASRASVERELTAIRELHARIKPGPGWRVLRDERLK